MWFVFCVWISSFAHEQVSLFSLFSFIFSDFIWFIRKKEATATERMRGKKGKKKEEAAERMREKKKEKEKKSRGERNN